MGHGARDRNRNRNHSEVSGVLLRRVYELGTGSRFYVPNAVRFTRFDKVLDHFPVSKGHAYERSAGFIASVAQGNTVCKRL